MRRGAGCAAALGVLAASGALAQTSACSRLTDAVDAVVSSDGYLGAVAFAVQRGQPVVTLVAGWRDLARRDAMQPDAIFRLYSMTKPMVSAVAMRLVEQGRLELDAPVSRWLPAYASLQVMEADGRLRAPLRPLTVRHLLTHQGGFAVDAASPKAVRERLDRAEPWKAADLAGYADRVAQAPLAADPGTRHAYDGVHTEVLSRLLEVVSGLPMARLMAEQMLEPLLLRDTGFEVPAARRARVVDLTARRPGAERAGEAGGLAIAGTRSAREPGAPLNAYASGAGGLYGTAADYGRFCAALAAGPWLSERSRKEMHTNQLPGPLPGRPGEGYGFGGAVGLGSADDPPPARAGLYGWTGAASTYFVLDVPRQRCMMLLMQHLHDDAPGDLPKVWPRLRPLLMDAAAEATAEAPCRR